ncbi:MAG TPA: hypothetical protein VFN97_28930 [Actinospica sp.]|nr:hypothetical protein [Actinospica sp.]
MPEVAGSWPEEGTQYVPGAPMEPAQQAYPQQAPYQTQQPYQQQGYPEQQYHQQPPQQQYPQEQTVPQQAVFAEEEQSSLPSEFDHLFRDSAPEGRRTISGRQPMVSGPGASPSPGFQTQQAPQQVQPQVPQQQAPVATAMYNQQPQDYPPGPSLDYNNGPFSYDGPPGGGGSDKRRGPLIIGAVVAVIAVVGLYLGLSGGGGSGKATAGSSSTAGATAKSNQTAQQEADAVYQLVTQAKQLRSDISAGVGKLRDCDIADAQSQINSTAQARSSAASQVATLPVDKISGASQVISALQKAWQDSATSDADYAKAAADFANGGCSSGALKKDSNYKQAEDTSSSADKKNAADLWNSIMTKYEPAIASDGSSL